MPEVRMPDGKVVRFPDEMPRDQIKAFIASKYPDAYQKPPSTGGRYLGALRDGVDALADGLTLGAGPYIRGAMRGAVTDQSVGEGVATEQTRQAERRDNRPVASFMNEMAGGAAGGLGLMRAGALASAHLAPNASRGQRLGAAAADGALLGEASGQLEGLAPGVGGSVGAVTGAAADEIGGRISRGVGNIARRRQVKAATRSVDDIADSQQAAYAGARSEGAFVPTSRMQELVGGARQRLADVALDRRLNPRPYQYLDILEEYATRPNSDGLDLRTLENVVSNIKADLRGPMEGSSRKALGEVLDVIEQFYEQPSRNFLASGDPDAAMASLMRGRSETRLLKKAQIIDDIFEARHGYLSGETSGIRNRVGAILRNKKLRRYFNEEELAAMKGIVDGGPVENLLHSIGQAGRPGLRRLLGIGGGYAVGGLPGAAAATVASPMADAAGDAMRLGNARSLQDLVNAGSPPPNVTQQMLTSPGGQAAVRAGTTGALTTGQMAPREQFMEQWEAARGRQGAAQ
jgi:hypothetical protein